MPRIRVGVLVVLDCINHREPQQRALRLIGFYVVTEESIMQSRTKDEVKGKTKERLGKLTNDPTLEGKAENKVGGFQEKTGPVDW